MISPQRKLAKTCSSSTSQSIKFLVHDFLSSAKVSVVRNFMFVALDILHLMHFAIAHSYLEKGEGKSLYTITNSNLCLDFIGNTVFCCYRFL
jgi:hypothetical protein